MDKAIHAPGPWKVDGGDGNNGERYIWTDRGEDRELSIGSREVCVAVVRGRRFDEGQGCTLEEILTADARLIAAAPDLLAALEAIMSGQIGGKVDHDAGRFRAAREAILKARGT